MKAQTHLTAPNGFQVTDGLPSSWPGSSLNPRGTWLFSLQPPLLITSTLNKGFQLGVILPPPRGQVAMSGDTLSDNLVVDVSVPPLQTHELTECSIVLNVAYYGLSVCPLNSYVETRTPLHDGVWRQSPSGGDEVRGWSSHDGISVLIRRDTGSFLPFLSLAP